MARGNSIRLDNGKEFATQKEATAFFKDILNSTISKITKDNEHYSNIMALYKRHPEFETKSKSEDNILCFIIKDSGEYNTKCFHAVHKDGNQTDWSYISAIKNKGKSKVQCFIDAARHSLELEIPHFRNNDFTNKCIQFLKENSFSENAFPEDWVSKATNSQYRATLLEPIRSDFIAWYKEL
jgi:hypothetical protein